MWVLAVGLWFSEFCVCCGCCGGVPWLVVLVVLGVAGFGVAWVFTFVWVTCWGFVVGH